MSRSPIRAEIFDLIDSTFRQLHGRATNQVVHTRVLPHLTDDQSEYLENHGLRSMVSEYFRQKNSHGLPHAPEVNAEGTHCQRELMTVDEYRYEARQYFRRGAQNIALGHRVIHDCAEVHGVVIDPGGLSDDQTGT